MDNHHTLDARPLHQATGGALPGYIFARTAFLLGAAVLCAGAWVLGGIAAATIMLALQIGALALVKPRTALGAATAFLVFLFVFFQDEPLVTGSLPAVFIYWGAGVATITGGLCLAWLPHRHRVLNRRKSASLVRFDRIMFALLALSLLASAYGIIRGNDWFATARQLFGCLLLPGYYLFARTFFRSVEDIDQWIKRACAAVTAGAAWYSSKIVILSFSEGAFAPVQSPMSFFAGIIGAALFAELLWERAPGKRTVIGLSLLVCVLAILLMGARFVAGSLAATAIIILILRRKRHRLLMGIGVLALAALTAGFALSHLPEMTELGGLYGGIASRFSPVNVGADPSWLERMAQMESVVDTVHQHPVLGNGMGAEIGFVNLSDNFFIATAYVDNGWGFVLLKMGLLGLLVFVVMLWRFLKFAAGSTLSDEVASARRTQCCLLALLLFGVLSFIGGPTFFEFLMSGFLGTTLGALAVLAHLASRPPHARQSPNKLAPIPCA